MRPRTSFVGYSSFALLIAIAAIALFGQTDGAGGKPSHAAGVAGTR
jgi:hypothetical protein